MVRKRTVQDSSESAATPGPSKPKSAKAAAAPEKRAAISAKPVIAKVPGSNGEAKAPKPAPLRKAPAAPASDDAPKVVHDPELGPIAEADLRKVKTGLTKKDYDHYRQLLLEKRAEILGDVASLQTDQRNSTGGNLSNMPLHMADVGSDHYEQEFTLGLVESERKLLHEINEALLRMQRGIYGVCLERGEPIGKPRLDAKPWAKYCIAVAREMERRGRTG